MVSISSRPHWVNLFRPIDSPMRQWTRFDRHQGIILVSGGMLLINPIAKYFQLNFNKNKLSFKKINLRISSVNCRHFLDQLDLSWIW